MALKTVSAASCGVMPAVVPASSTHNGIGEGHEEASLAKPADEKMRDFLTFLDQTASSSLHNAATPSARRPSAQGTSNASLLSKISAMEVELEDKDHSLKALKELREREKLKEEHVRKQLQLQMRNELTKTAVGRPNFLERWHVAFF